MEKNIYKIVSDIAKEEILQHCEYEKVPDYGDVKSFEDFMVDVEYGCIMDYDGDGKLILHDKVVKGSSLWVDEGYVCLKKFAFIPFEKLHKIFGNEMKFLWFNK